MHYVIAGKINCLQFSYAVLVAQRLTETLPNFHYTKIPKKEDEWQKWLKNCCKENGWYHLKSPLIWREMGMVKGKKTFIGDMNKFLDLCYDYYGVPREILSGENFNRGEMDWFADRMETHFFENIANEAEKRRNYRSRQICITGASTIMAEILIMELLQLPNQRRENGLEIRLFDEESKLKKLHSSAVDANHCPGVSGYGNCRVVHTLKEALLNIDMVIVLDNFARKYKESIVKWLKRNRNAMCALGKALNKFAPPHCRVIIGGFSNQPLCYNATVLASFATKLHVRNIVVVTQDLGREMLKILSNKTKVPLKEFYCPPVWGFVGLNKYVDVTRTLQTHVYKVPGKRRKSTLPQGTEEYELRTTECLLSYREVSNLHFESSNIKVDRFPKIGRNPCLAKVTAIVDLLKLWHLKQEDGNGEILCLGVYSDGTFNIPEGVYWSQPVILKKGFWVPFEDFPIPRHKYVNCFSFFLTTIAALYRTKVKPRRYVAPKVNLKSKGIKKFDFEKFAENVGMPVIRTDKECVEYLKMLVKQEYGFDLDYVDDTIKEDAEPVDIAKAEEVEKERIYCECWRQELLRWQKIAFDHSSTTEVEVDLSDNISGSEFSVINSPVGSISLGSGMRTENGSDVQPVPSYGIKSEISSQRSGIPGMSEKSIFSVKSSKTSRSTVCSCEPRPDGTPCDCLGPQVTESFEIFRGRESIKEYEREVSIKTSTEHYYREQNAQVFTEDVNAKDVLYEDTYQPEKHITFDPRTKAEEDESKEPLFKFYGRKEAIRDLKADARMKKRIKNYKKFIKREKGETMGEERELEEELEEEEESQEEEEEVEIVEEDKKDKKEKIKKSKHSKKSDDTEMEKEPQENPDDPKFHIQIEGVPYDIIGDQNGLENLDEAQRSAPVKESSGSFRDMYSDGMMPSLQVLSTNLESSSETESEKTMVYSGESKYSLKISDLSQETVREVTSSTTEEVENVWPKEFSGEAEMHGEDYYIIKIPPKRKRQGIPLCCLCRCIIPEGLPICPCGETTVVEMFKKESIEVLVDDADSLTFRVEYLETEPTTQSTPESELERFPKLAPSITESKSEESTYGETLYRSYRSKGPSDVSVNKIDQQVELKSRDLPPESFFPFTPKYENKFEESTRPERLTKDYFVTKMKEIPEKCLELLKMANEIIEEENLKKGDEETEEESRRDTKSVIQEESEDMGNEDKFDYKREFSDVNMFLPDGIEDWRITFQRKYQEWFYQGSKIRDDSYYDFAVEEVSDDEFELDRELEKYFEA